MKGILKNAIIPKLMKFILVKYNFIFHVMLCTIENLLKFLFNSLIFYLSKFKFFNLKKN